MRISSQHFDVDKMAALKSLTIEDMDDIVNKGVFQKIWNKEDDHDHREDGECKVCAEAQIKLEFGE